MKRLFLLLLPALLGTGTLPARDSSKNSLQILHRYWDIKHLYLVNPFG